MHKLLIFLSCVVAVLSTSTPTNPQVIRIGSVGLTIADIKGSLIPKSGPSAAVPVFEFKSTEAGSPAHESEYFNFRCGVITEFYEPKADRPVLLCRNSAFNKDTSAPEDKMVFIFTHDDLVITPNVKTVQLLVGKTTVRDFVGSHPNVPVTKKKYVMEGVYDGFMILGGKTSPYDTLLEYGI